jgi:3-phosphoshikimate 1-carboxyvinyltransferase
MTMTRALRSSTRPVHATVEVPGSKSIANRALAIAALADGDSALMGVPDGDDTVAMLACLGGLGVTTEHLDDGSAGVVVAGRGGAFESGATLHAGLAGTTSRFVTAMAALAPGSVTIDGDPPLRARPMAELHGALRSLGVQFEYLENEGHLPVTVTGPLRSGGHVALRGDVSSQFITALMLVGPLLERGLSIGLTTPLVSVPYVQLTAAVMADFGVTDVAVDERRILMPPGRYRGRSYHVEPDSSSASYPLAIAAVRGGSVTVPGLTRSSHQGDIAVLELLRRMGCDVVGDDSATTISRDQARPLTGIDVDMADVSDLVPTVAAVAVTAATPTTIRGVGFIRAKESDRLGDLATELRKTGAAVDVTDDGLHIEPVADLHGATLETHHDHRLAMAFAVLGSVVNGIVVNDPGVVSKSWPGFWVSYDALLATSPGT